MHKEIGNLFKVLERNIRTKKSMFYNANKV